MRQDRERELGGGERNGGMSGFDSLMLTSTGTISLMEGGVAGWIKETERDRRLICAERKHERAREEEKPARQGGKEAEIHRAITADVLSQTCLKHQAKV